jgi:hypothetical protein
VHLVRVRPGVLDLADQQQMVLHGRPAARAGSQRRREGPPDQLADRDNAYEQGIRGIRGIEY